MKSLALIHIFLMGLLFFSIGCQHKSDLEIEIPKKGNAHAEHYIAQPAEFFVDTVRQWHIIKRPNFWDVPYYMEKFDIDSNDNVSKKRHGGQQWTKAITTEYHYGPNGLKEEVLLDYFDRRLDKINYDYKKYIKTVDFYDTIVVRDSLGKTKYHIYDYLKDGKYTKTIKIPNVDHYECFSYLANGRIESYRQNDWLFEDYIYDDNNFLIRVDRKTITGWRDVFNKWKDKFTYEENESEEYEYDFDDRGSVIGRRTYYIKNGKRILAETMTRHIEYKE